MTRPIQAKDLCEVIGGLGRGKSPNLGLRVTVVSAQGEHSQYGMVWRCTGDPCYQLGDAGQYVNAGWADFPAIWLKRIEPPAPAPKSIETDREVTA